VTDPSDARAPGAGPARPLDEAAAALALWDAPDLDALEDRLLALATHRHGLGAARAWLLAWNARTGRFEGRRRRATGDERALGDAVRHPAPGSGAEADAFRLHRSAPSDLDPVLAAAWAEGAARDGRCGASGAPWDGREVTAVPLRLDLRPWALLVVEGGVRAALPSFARVAATAADAVVTADAGRRRARRAAALHEAARAVVSSHNLAEVVRLVARLAAHATGARGSALWLAAGRAGVRLEATHGPAGQRESLARALQPVADTVAASGVAFASDAVPDDARLAPAVRERLQSLCVVPVTAFEASLGALAVYDRAALHPAHAPGFDGEAREFLRALADLAAGAAGAAAREDRLRAAEARVADLRARARRRERLAELGEGAARLVREARNPLASIAAFARRVRRALADDAPQREYLEIVIREADRLERLLAEQAGLVASEPPGLRVEGVNTIVQEALQQCAEALVRRRVRLLKRLAPDVPALLVDPLRMRQVVRNLLQHAVDRVPVGGRIRVETRRAGQHVVVDVAHDGARAAGEALEALFVPFATGGEDTGLAAAQRIVREHGGEVRLRGDGAATTVSFTLPVPGNEERRRGGERRVTRGDRRAAAR